MKSIPVVVFTHYSPRWSYFQYILLGLYHLEEQRKIRIKYKCDYFFRFSRYMPGYELVRKIFSYLLPRFVKDSCLVTGYVEILGKKNYFCIDSADSPYIFSESELKKSDSYFKMQCPKEIKAEGFRLTDDVIIPYCDYEFQKGIKTRKFIADIECYKHKIKPLMVGFRSLGYTNSKKALEKGFLSYREGMCEKAEGRMMCYFGNALGPQINDGVVEPDFDSEADLMGYYKDKLSHPNIKRARIASLLSQKGDGYDARVISGGYCNKKDGIEKSLIVPLKDFCRHISKFEYNVNVSGFRLSIPNRFIESFIVGTAIFTDKLYVKWYQPFGKEVFETAEMGYLKEDSVDWNKISSDLVNAPIVNKKEVLSAFDEKWAPEKVASYMINTIIGN